MPGAREKFPTLDGAFWRRFHLAMTGLWALLAVPETLWWHDSVLAVGVMSAYANLIGHFSAFQAARAEGSTLWCRVHLALTAAWAVLIWPTVEWWHDSVLWVGLMSAYALVVGHLSAWQAARIDVHTTG